MEVFPCDILYIFLPATSIFFFFLLYSLHRIYSPSFPASLLRVELSCPLSLWALTPWHVMCPWKLLMGKGAGTSWMLGMIRQKWGKGTEVWYKYTLQLWKLQAVRLGHISHKLQCETTSFLSRNHPSVNANNSTYSALTFLLLII